MIRLLALDIDNTVFNWVDYYVKSLHALFDTLERVTGVARAHLVAEARGVFTMHNSIEHPFLVQELPSVLAVYGTDYDKLLHEAVDPARDAFNTAANASLVPYPGVVETLTAIRTARPNLPIVALTDAPRYVAMWKLNKLGLLTYFDAVYGLPDPTLPTAEGRVLVDMEILLKHVRKDSFGYKGKIRILPEDYEKPGTKGFRMVLMDFDIEEQSIARKQILFVGDNLAKDIHLGKELGILSCWARYGAQISPAMRTALQEFSPAANTRKNVALDPAGSGSPRPDYVIDQFSELRGIPGI